MYSYGIDLGTTYSCIARVDEKGNVEIIKNEEGKNITPSVVQFIAPTEIVVGESAKGEAVLAPESVVLYIKRSMAKKKEDPEYFEKDFFGEIYKAEQVSALILKKLVADAEKMTGEKITDVVITVPAYFGFDERQATENAGKIAGLNVLGIVNEPTAAAIAYGATSKKKEDKVILVYDLGGGTFDITVAEIIGDDVTVIATNGNHSLGGKNWDAELISYFVSQFCEKTGVNEDEIYDDTAILNELVLRTEEAKKILKDKNTASFVLNMGPGKRAKLEVTIDKFNELTRHHLLSTIELTKVVLKEAATKMSSKGKPGDQFDEIIFVGGSTRMRQVKDAIMKEFGVEPQIFEPDEAIARGAALLAQYLQKNAQDSSASNGIKPGDTSPFTEVTSKSYGIETLVDGKEKLSNVILKNDQIPLSNTKTYYTVQADQRMVNIDVYESNIMENVTDLSNGKKIANGRLDLPAGLPDEAPLDVTFSLDRNGMLSITAVERSRGNKCNITVKTEGLTDAEVAKLQNQTRKMRVTEDVEGPSNEESNPTEDGDDPWKF